jgi:hypothetical protein
MLVASLPGIPAAFSNGVSAVAGVPAVDYIPVASDISAIFFSRDKKITKFVLSILIDVTINI